MELLSVVAVAVTAFAGVLDIYRHYSLTRCLALSVDDGYRSFDDKPSGEPAHAQRSKKFFRKTVSLPFLSRVDVKSHCGSCSLSGHTRNCPSEAEYYIGAISEHSSPSKSLRGCEH